MADIGGGIMKRETKKTVDRKTVRNAFSRNSRDLLREGKEVRQKVRERIEPITKIGDRELRFRLQ